MRRGAFEFHQSRLLHHIPVNRMTGNGTSQTAAASINATTSPTQPQDQRGNPHHHQGVQKACPINAAWQTAAAIAASTSSSIGRESHPHRDSGVLPKPSAAALASVNTTAQPDSRTNATRSSSVSPVLAPAPLPPSQQDQQRSHQCLALPQGNQVVPAYPLPLPTATSLVPVVQYQPIAPMPGAIQSLQQHPHPMVQAPSGAQPQRLALPSHSVCPQPVPAAIPAHCGPLGTTKDVSTESQNGSGQFTGGLY